MTKQGIQKQFKPSLLHAQRTDTAISLTLTVEMWNGVGTPNIGNTTVSYFRSEKNKF